MIIAFIKDSARPGRQRWSVTSSCLRACGHANAGWIGRAGRLSGSDTPNDVRLALLSATPVPGHRSPFASPDRLGLRGGCGAPPGLAAASSLEPAVNFSQQLGEPAHGRWIGLSSAHACSWKCCSHRRRSLPVPRSIISHSLSKMVQRHNALILQKRGPRSMM